MVERLKSLVFQHFVVQILYKPFIEFDVDCLIQPKILDISRNEEEEAFHEPWKAIPHSDIGLVVSHLFMR